MPVPVVKPDANYVEPDTVELPVDTVLKLLLSAETEIGAATVVGAARAMATRARPRDRAVANMRTGMARILKSEARNDGSR